MHRLAFALIIGLFLVLTACTGGPAATSPAPQATADAGDGDGDDSPAPAETDAAGDGDGDGDGVNPGGATDLEGLIPDEVNGVQINTASFSGADQFEEGGFDVDAFAEAAGVSPDQVSIAIGSDEGGEILIFAVRVDGRSADEALNALLESDDTGLQDAVQESNVGGKDVLISELGTTAIILYTAGDVVFEIIAERTMAEAALDQLP